MQHKSASIPKHLGTDILHLPEHTSSMMQFDYTRGGTQLCEDAGMRSLSIRSLSKTSFHLLVAELQLRIEHCQHNIEVRVL